MRIVNRKLFHSLFLTAVIRTFRLRIIISVDLCTKLLYSESTFFKVSRTFRLDVVIFNTNKLVLYTSTGHSCRYDQRAANMGANGIWDQRALISV